MPPGPVPGPNRCPVAGAPGRRRPPLVAPVAKAYAARMPLTSITRLRLRSARFLPGFALHTWRSARQARRSPGYLSGYFARGRGLTFWTVTTWADPDAMRAYRNNGAHVRPMPRLIGWCGEAADRKS